MQLQELPNTYGKTKFQLKRISYFKEDSVDSIPNHLPIGKWFFISLASKFISLQPNWSGLIGLIPTISFSNKPNY
jgi:hypothetical protein